MKLTLVRAVTLASALVAPVIASAANWALFSTNENTRVFVDFQSIVVKGSTKSYWVKYENITPVEQKYGLVSVTRQLEKIDCRSRTITTVAWADYGVDEKLLRNANPAHPEAIAVVPDTFHEALYKFACRRES